MTTSNDGISSRIPATREKRRFEALATVLSGGVATLPEIEEHVQPFARDIWKDPSYREIVNAMAYGGIVKLDSPTQDRLIEIIEQERPFSPSSTVPTPAQFQAMAQALEANKPELLTRPPADWSASLEGKPMDSLTNSLTAYVIGGEFYVREETDPRLNIPDTWSRVDAAPFFYANAANELNATLAGSQLGQVIEKFTATPFNGRWVVGITPSSFLGVGQEQERSERALTEMVAGELRNRGFGDCNVLVTYQP